MDLSFTKNKTNTYNIFLIKNNRPTKIKINTPTMFSPFGIESYNNKLIMNLEFYNIDSNNQMYNFFSYIKTLDNILTTNPPQELTNKTYISCIKERNNNPLLRIHLRVIKTNIITAITDYDNKYVTTDSVKNKKIQGELEIGTLWYTDETYGIIIYANSCKLV